PVVRHPFAAELDRGGDDAVLREDAGGRGRPVADDQCQVRPLADAAVDAGEAVAFGKDVGHGLMVGSAVRTGTATRAGPHSGPYFFSAYSTAAVPSLYAFFLSCPLQSLVEWFMSELLMSYLLLIT